MVSLTENFLLIFQNKQKKKQMAWWFERQAPRASTDADWPSKKFWKTRKTLTQTVFGAFKHRCKRAPNNLAGLENRVSTLGQDECCLTTTPPLSYNLAGESDLSWVWVAVERIHSCMMISQTRCLFLPLQVTYRFLSQQWAFKWEYGFYHTLYLNKKNL